MAPIGILTIILAHHLGCKDMIIAGHHQNRLDLFQAWTGAKTVNTHKVALSDSVEKLFDQKADVIFETTGRPGVVSESFGLLERGGTLVVIGTYRENVELNANDVMLYEYAIIGSVSYYRSEMEEVVRMLDEGLLTGKEIITHAFGLEDHARAFEVVKQRKDNIIKACFQL